MECRFCHRAFSKGEHLRRHERSHTGSRPFICKECNRPFGRQDSLARHERLHTRKITSRQTSPLPKQTYNPVTPESFHNLDVDTSSCNTGTFGDAIAQVRTPTESQTTSKPDYTAIQPSADVDFELIWPDSEDLYQSIVSFDANYQWPLPLGTLPFASEPYPTSNFSLNTPNSFDDRVPSIGAIPSGGNHQAVHDVTKMITNSSSSVTAAVESTSISSVFLDECLHMFFVRFIPTFKILHRSTFVFRDCTHPLLLNAIAIGSLYLGPKDAVAKGEVLWRLAHTALATSWQTLITHRGPYDARPGVQLLVTALLGQIYGALSKNRAVRTTSQAFHALGFFWARHCGMYDCEPYQYSSLPNVEAPETEKDQQWRKWVAREIQQRALLAHYTLDGLIAQMTGEPTSERHAANTLGLPGSDAAFDANTADEWLAHMQSQSMDQSSFGFIIRTIFSPTEDLSMLKISLSAFSLRVVLESLQSLISDPCGQNQPMLGIPTVTEVRQALGRLYDIIMQNINLSAEERLETLLRWHAISLDSLVRSVQLGKSICTHYRTEQHVWPNGSSPKTKVDLINWPTTKSARKALLHAVAIQDIVEQLPRGRAHVIHMPSSLFAAATVYSAFALTGAITVKIPSLVDWNEVMNDLDIPTSPMVMTTTNAISDTMRYIRGEGLPNSHLSTTSRNLLYEFNSMQKLFRCLYTQWGVAFDMEKVVDQWIDLCHAAT